MRTKLDPNVIKPFDSWINDYDLLSFHFNEIKRKTTLGQKIGHCRFCKKSIPEVSFKQKAHALPQFIGNNFLLSYYECDACNDHFSRKLENEMANFIKPFHTIYGIKGEKNIPVYKSKEVRLESDGAELIINSFNDSTLTGDLSSKEFTLSLNTDKFIPIGVYKCLTKMALTIMPETEVVLFDRTFKWLQEEKHSETEFRLDNLWVIYSQLTEDMTFPHMSVNLLKRRSISSPLLPSFIFRLSYFKFSFQIYLPLCDLDIGKKFTIHDFKYFPHLFDVTKGIETSEKIYIDCTSKEKCEVPIDIEFNNLDK